MLDKQKILSELGNVVNQLQSADCGCMGKLFSPTGQPNNSNMAMRAAGGCCKPSGCCHGHVYPGYNAPCAGEPCQGARHCTGGSCNPQKLYADTYGYLNQNLMQPVVKEVYDELKSISPENTVMNNPMAAQMGILNGSNRVAAGVGNVVEGNMGAMSTHQALGAPIIGGGMVSSQMPHSHFDQPQVGNTNISNVNNIQNSNSCPKHHKIGQMGCPMGNMGGVGPHIVNMMHHNQHQPPNSMGDMPKHHVNTDQIQCDSGVLPNNAVHYNTRQMEINNGVQGNQVTPIQYLTMQPTNMNQSNNTRMYERVNAHDNFMPSNPGYQGMQTTNTNCSQQQMIPRNSYGQHKAGMAKFNEMFPGVVQGDLGFDPMAIAIQMNPANQQKAAMDAMQKMMTSHHGGINSIMDSRQSTIMQPVMNATNVASAQIAQTNEPQRQGVSSTQNNRMPSQPTRTALTGFPTMNQQYQVQAMIDRGGNLPTVYEGSSDADFDTHRQFSQDPIDQIICKEPILPADTSRNIPPQLGATPHKNYYYNTLGQPVEMVPASIYRSPEPQNLPQTLSPQPTKPNYSNVKYTVSKTALLGKRAVGKAPSRSQLQNLYNQYKGSQSYTEQHIKPSPRGASHSEGNINAAQVTTNHVIPVEKVNGDTGANNNLNIVIPKVNDGDGLKPPMEGDKPVPFKKTRNGLQDVVFTSYPTSAAWSFHGNR